MTTAAPSPTASTALPEPLPTPPRAAYQIYVRAEGQAVGSYTGYSPALAAALSAQDLLPFINPGTNTPYNQATIPLGPINSAFKARILRPTPPPAYSITKSPSASRTPG